MGREGSAVSENLPDVAAAICNATYHATGKRLRNMPVTMDKLL